MVLTIMVNFNECCMNVIHYLYPIFIFLLLIILPVKFCKGHGFLTWNCSEPGTFICAVPCNQCPFSGLSGDSWLLSLLYS